MPFLRVFDNGSGTPFFRCLQMICVMEANEGCVNDLISVLMQTYLPAESVENSDEMKTTLELLDEFESMVDVSKDTVFAAMQSAGFKTWYTGYGFVWLLKTA